MKAATDELAVHAIDARSTALVFLDLARRMIAACGVGSLLALGFTQDGSTSGDSLALIAVVAIGSATALGWLQMVLGPRVRQPLIDRVERWKIWPWRLATIAVILGVGLAAQTWFQAGTAIAGGDITPVEGTAWLSRLFEPWTWDGSHLGGPSQLTLQLPWAVILGVVHAVGGSAEIAQRIWYTTLFIGAGLGAFAFIAALRMGPGAALVGTAAYLFNPYVVSIVGTNPVFIAALLLLAAVPATLVAAGTGRLAIRWAVTLIALAAPVFGYVYANPPLIGMVVGAMITSPLIAGLIGGRYAGLRCLRCLVLAIPLLVAGSAYWIVPEFLHFPSVASEQLSSLSSWSWTETRGTLRNALWLNTSWAWGFPEYTPYATAYDVVPLSIIRFVLPAIAFGALVFRPDFRRRRRGVLQHARAFGLAIASSTVAIVIIFLSTGTNPPGNLAFNFLYNLPFGWLLREPGRFLMFAALAYAILVAIVVDGLDTRRPILWLREFRHGSARVWHLAVAAAVLLTVLSLGIPLYTGLVVPDTRPTLPPAHVTVPAYWSQMAQIVDGLPTQGALLVMPPDDFYQMPYTWGYYGTDYFISDLFHRPVVVPNGQGYSPASSQLVNAVNLTARSILSGDWRQTEALVRAMNTPLILVRHDIDPTFVGRVILPPSDLAAALSTAPNFDLVRRVGSLELFALRSATTESERLSTYVTINTLAPDLRLLSLLGPDTTLVTGVPLTGIGNVSLAPPLEMWQHTGDRLTWQPDKLPGWSYSIAELESRTVVSIDHPLVVSVGRSNARVVVTRDIASTAVTVSVTGRTAISNGDFANGPWGSVSDCAAFQKPEPPLLRADIVRSGAPGGFSALRLSASDNSACESQQLDWHGGPLLVSLMVHPVQGLAPRICLYEVGAGRCAPIPNLPTGSGWSSYWASVTPDIGTKAITVFLYADSVGALTVNEYADVRVDEVPALPSFALFAKPDDQFASSMQLVVLHNSYSTQWGSTQGQHVIVDGMLNGWLVPLESSEPFLAFYEPANMFRAGQLISLVTLLGVVPITFMAPLWCRVIRRTFRHRRGRGIVDRVS